MGRLGTVAVTPIITEIIDEGLFKSLTAAVSRTLTPAI
jgi:hypothetical protein